MRTLQDYSADTIEASLTFERRHGHHDERESYYFDLIGASC